MTTIPLSLLVEPARLTVLIENQAEVVPAADAIPPQARTIEDTVHEADLGSGI
jgi:hypothetical protein